MPKPLPRMLATVAVAGVSIVLAEGCGPPSCMEDGYARAARGSSDYVTSAGAATYGADAAGIGPETFVLRRYRPFEEGTCAGDEGPFEIEIQPRCRLPAVVTSRKHDTGKNASGDFLQAEAALLPRSSCTLTLEGGRTARGRVESGSVTLLPSGGSVTVLLSLEEWEGARRTTGSLRLRIEGTWID